MFRQETQFHLTLWPIAVLGNHYVSNTPGKWLIVMLLFPVLFTHIHITPVDENHHIGILLDGATLPEVG
jgi:hypothetical protein